MESQDWVPQILCDDHTMRDDDPLQQFTRLALSGMQKLGCCHIGDYNVKQAMLKAGFVDLRLVKLKIPIGSWPKDKRQKYIGLIMKTLVSESLDIYASKSFEALGISPEERKRLISRVRTSLDDTGINRYMSLCFCYGRKGAPAVPDVEYELS